MALGDSLNSLAGGYARGQAQYAANEKARQDAAAAGAKAAQEAAEFRLRLAQHDQTLRNSAETEWKTITDMVEADDWSPSKLSLLLPRVANFKKSYYDNGIWRGGDPMETIRQALHLGSDEQQMKPEEQGTPDPNAVGQNFGFVSDEQRMAHGEKARKMRTEEAARVFAVGAAEYINSKYPHGVPDEATYMREVNNYQDAAVASGGGKYDPEVLDKAIDIGRENIAAYFAAVARDMDKLSGRNDLSVKIADKIEATRKTVSTLITSLLQFDQKEGGVMGDNFFAQRTPIRLAMEADNNRWSAYMEPNQVISNLITKYSNIEGGLNLDPNAAPWVGALTIAGLPPEGVRALNRFYDLGVAPNPSVTNPVFVNGVLGMIDYSDPTKQWEIWRATPTPEKPTVMQDQGTPYMKAPAGSRGNVSLPPAKKTAPSPAVKKPERPKEPEVSVEELMARDPSTLNGVEMTRVTNSMTGPEFVRWLVGKDRKK